MSSKKSQSSQAAESSQKATSSVAGAKRGRKRSGSQGAAGAKRVGGGKPIADATVTHLFHLANGERKAKLLPSKVLEATNAKVEELLRVAVQFIPQGRKTLSGPHVVSALELLGVDAGAADAGKGRYSSAKRAGTEAEDGKKKKKFKAGTINKREAKKIQKSGKSVTTKAGIRRLVITWLKNITGNDDSRASASAKEIIQVYVENYIVSLLHDAILIANHSKRNTVAVRDVELALRIRREID